MHRLNEDRISNDIANICDTYEIQSRELIRDLFILVLNTITDCRLDSQDVLDEFLAETQKDALKPDVLARKNWVN